MKSSRETRETFDDALYMRFRADLRGMMDRCYPYRWRCKCCWPPELNRTLVRLSLPLLERLARRLQFACRRPR